MRSESCSFIWQPNVVTWNASRWRGGYRAELRIEGGSGGGEISRGVAKLLGMRAETTPDRRLADSRARSAQHGVVSRAQLWAIGLRSTTAIRRRVRSGAAAPALPRRLRRRAHGREPLDGRYLAAVMACGDGAVLSHRSAAALWGIRPTAAARIDVTVPRTSGVRSTRAIVVHRPTTAASTPTTHAGIPVTTPGQTLADLATALPRRALEKAAEMAEALRLHVEVPDPATPAPRRLGGARRRTTSGPRHAARSRTRSSSCATRHGIPRPLVNADRRGLRGRLLLAGRALIVETDGYEHHGTRAAFERDRAQDAQLTAAAGG